MTLYSGDHISSHDDLFLGIEKIDPFSENNAQFSLSGPVPGFDNRLTFFATGRRVRYARAIGKDALATGEIIPVFAKNYTLGRDVWNFDQSKPLTVETEAGAVIDDPVPCIDVSVEHKFFGRAQAFQRYLLLSPRSRKFCRHQEADVDEIGIVAFATNTR